MIDSLTELLESFVTDRRKEQFDRIVNLRTRYITVALEDIYQSQNASAVLRTCDCLGIQDAHIIENRNRYQLNPDVTLGSDKWISVTKYNSSGNNSLAAISELKSKGYRIVATTPHRNDTGLDNFDLAKGKIALFFGTELSGLSQDVINNADEFIKIPMFGFTESFNISVSASIILYALTRKLRASDLSWPLAQEELKEIKLSWLRSTVKKSGIIEKEFLGKSAQNQDIVQKD